MEEADYGLSPASTRMTKWALSLLGVSITLILVITEYSIKVSSQVWAILLTLPWIGLVVVIVYAVVRDQEWEGIFP